MADTWGTLVLNITAYRRLEQAHVVEMPLVPAPGATTAQSVLIGSGRLRRRRAVEGWATKADFDSLVADYESQARKTVTFDDGFSMTAVLEELEGERRLGTDLVWYRATFVEA